MRKFLSPLIKNHYRVIFRSLIYSDKSFAEVDLIKLKFNKDCMLGNKNDSLYMPIDEIITPHVFKKGNWEYVIIKFIKEKIRHEKHSFIDVGANIGLITKQLIIKKIKLKSIFCFEPNERNFSCLKKNVGIYKNVKLYNYGLGLKNTKKKLYSEKMNFGDCSFKKKTKNFQLSKIKNINTFFKKNIKELENVNLIYKSDTQGMDEIIFLSIKTDYLDKIKIASLEITNHEYLKKNKKKFFQILQKYKVIKDNNLNNLTTQQIKKNIDNSKEFQILLSKY